MRGFLLAVAYFLMYTTPVQLGFVVWSAWVVLTTDETVLSLTNDVFLRDHLPLFYAHLKPWLYSFLWNPLLDFAFSLPIVLHASLKAVVNTLISLVLFSVVRDLASYRPSQPGTADG